MRTRRQKHRAEAKTYTPCKGRKHIAEMHQFNIDQAKATRAVYLSPDVQRIEVELITEDGEHLIACFPSRLAGELIIQMTGAYEAIHPTLRTGLGTASWRGMDG
jgi:hypothetical protein